MSDVCLETNVGCKLTLKELKHVPNSCLNLISGFTKLTKGSLVITKWEACCTLYETQGRVCNNDLHATKGTSLELWHKGLGHMSEKGLQVF